MAGIFAAAIIGALLSSTWFESGDDASGSVAIAPVAEKASDRDRVPAMKPEEIPPSTSGHSRVPSEPPLSTQVLPQPASPTVWPTQGVAPPMVIAMLAVAMTDDKEAILLTKATLDAFPKPMSGDQAVAREKNEAGMNALKEAAYETAIARLNEGIEAAPGDAELRNNLGHALMIFGRFDDAKRALIDSIALDAARGAAWVNLGLALAAQGDHDSAAAAFIASVAVSKPGESAIEYLTTLSQLNAHPGVKTAAARALESRTVRDSTAAAPLR